MDKKCARCGEERAGVCLTFCFLEGMCGPEDYYLCDACTYLVTAAVRVVLGSHPYCEKRAGRMFPRRDAEGYKDAR